MRKAALQLLTALLLYNPFGGELPEGRFEASLTEWKAKLQVISLSLPMALPEGFSRYATRPFQAVDRDEGQALQGLSHSLALDPLYTLRNND